ncbi:hypothetical protein VTJ04DRAFT_5308 [Mycothermus thermophilus]|uniref:uncharacterized protein n=1 Tax=Humicola insolens TaxID=85995 RepID=UPI003743CAC2
MMYSIVEKSRLVPAPSSRRRCAYPPPTSRPTKTQTSSSPPDDLALPVPSSPSPKVFLSSLLPPRRTTTRFAPEILTHSQLQQNSARVLKSALTPTSYASTYPQNKQQYTHYCAKPTPTIS